jgi:hypothetical protein
MQEIVIEPAQSKDFALAADMRAAMATEMGGVVRALMLAGIDWIRSKDCVVVRLNSSEDGVALYESLGFKPRREMEFSLE